METLKIFIKTEEGEEEEKDIKTQFPLEETPCNISTLLILDKFIRVPDAVLLIHDILERSRICVFVPLTFGSGSGSYSFLQ
jgi:hypothetical protein